MFMTRMALDVNRPETQQAISNPALLQAAVDAAFNGLSVHTLWRTEQLNHRLHLIMLSPLRPTLGPAHQQYGYPGAFPSWETWSLEDEMDELQPGMRLHFRLCAATGSAMDQSESLSRMAQETTAYQLEWLRTHCAEYGFRFDEGAVEVLHSPWVTWSDPEHAARLLTCHQAVFDGELVVADAEHFAQAMERGIGEYDRMGAGLITVEPVQKYRFV